MTASKVHKRIRHRIPKSRDEIVIEWIATIVLGIIIVVCLYPFLNVLAKSFSSEGPILAGEVFLIPKGFTTLAYEIVLGSPRFWNSFRSSVFITVVGTALNLLLTAFVAFALSRKNLPGQKLIAFLYIFTMLFGGGLIPTYLVVVNSGLYNTLWSLIIPGAGFPLQPDFDAQLFCNHSGKSGRIRQAGWGRTFHYSFPHCSSAGIARSARLCLFCAVGTWNEYFNALIYINDRNIVPIQVYLREILLNAGSADLNNMDAMLLVAQEAVRGATVFAATVPILLIYPFLQKYYVQGMTTGAIKE